MKYTSFDDFFSVLGNKNRVRILQVLDKKGPLSVNDIAKELGAEQSATSHWIKRLLMCHFVDVKQEGKERIYFVNQHTVKPLINLIDEHVRNYCVKNCEHSGTSTNSSSEARKLHVQ